MESHSNSASPSIFDQFPEAQWIVLGAVAASLVFQFLFYVYFFCSFSRNYSRNLTLKSYRKGRMSINDIENMEDATTYTEGASYFTSDDHTVDLPQRNMPPRLVHLRQKAARQNGFAAYKAFDEHYDRARMALEKSQTKDYKSEVRRTVDEVKEEAEYITMKQNDPAPVPAPVRQHKHLHQQNRVHAVDARALKHGVKTDGEYGAQSPDEFDLRPKEIRSVSKQAKARPAQKHDIKVEDLETSMELQEVADSKAKARSRQRRANNPTVREDREESKQSPHVRVLNERREQSNNKKGRASRAQRVARSKPETQGTGDRLDLYEVYFNRHGAQVSQQQNKTNIQKIKFKRRSPSIESF